MIMMNIFDKIKDILEANPCAVIAIDGMCASGKTTFASRLSEEFGFQTVHTDDFFLPFDMRTQERLSLPGGNIHRERLIDEVITPLKEKRDAVYRVFDCSSGTYTEKRTVFYGRPVIIEGVYSLHPEIPDIYDFKMFFCISPETQLERIGKRNGTEALEVFKEKWIPFENRYLKKFGIPEKCDIILTGMGLK